MTRTWLSIVAVGALATACAESKEPPPLPGTAPVGDTGMPPQSRGPGAIPPGPMSDNLPSSGMNANPPGTPGYIIAPGDPVGARGSQIPQPGGRPGTF